MLRTSNHLHGITHVIFEVIDVYWLMTVLYQNTDIDTNEYGTYGYYYTVTQ